MTSAAVSNVPSSPPICHRPAEKVQVRPTPINPALRDNPPSTYADIHIPHSTMPLPKRQTIPVKGAKASAPTSK
jgi:hypothetical protein